MPNTVSNNELAKTSARVIGATTTFVAWCYFCSIRENTLSIVGSSTGNSSSAKIVADVVMGTFALATGSNWGSNLGTALTDVKNIFTQFGEMSAKQRVEGITRIVMAIVAASAWIAICAISQNVSANISGVNFQATQTDTTAQQVGKAFLFFVCFCEALGYGANSGANLAALPYDLITAAKGFAERLTKSRHVAEEIIAQDNATPLLTVGASFSHTPLHRSVSTDTDDLETDIRISIL